MLHIADRFGRILYCVHSTQQCSFYTIQPSTFKCRLKVDCQLWFVGGVVELFRNMPRAGIAEATFTELRSCGSFDIVGCFKCVRPLVVTDCTQSMHQVLRFTGC